MPFQLLLGRYSLPPAGVSPSPRVGSVVVTPTIGAINHPGALQLVTEILDKLGDPLSGAVPNYATSDAAVMTVDANGLITSVGAGSASITVSYDRRSTVVPITVNGAPAVVDAVSISPATDQSVLVGAAILMEATPTAAGVELPATMSWESETGSRVTINAASGPTYKHALVTGVGVGTTRIRARAVGAGAAGVDVISNWVNFTIATTAPTGEPNLPVGWTIFSDWEPQSLPFPVNTANAQGWKITAGGDYSRVAILADASAPSGFVMRVYFPPTHDGGGGPEHLSNDFSSVQGVYIQQLKRLSPGFTNSSNAGTKDLFVRMASQANSLYLNKFSGSSDQGHAGVNVQGITFTGGSQSSVQTNFSWNNLMDGSLHLWECVIRQQSATSVHDAHSSHYMDGAVDKLTTNRQFINDGVAPSTRGFVQAHKSGTFGGGHNRPPGIVGTGGTGAFTRSLGLYAKLGAVNPSNNRQFIRAVGQVDFDTTNSSSDDARDWTVIYADGTKSGPHQIISANRTTTTLTFPVGVNVTNAVAVVSGFEVFVASHVGDTIYLRSPTLDYHPTTNPGGTGLYPLLLQTTVLALSSVNFPNDTVTFSGNPGSGTMWLFGLDANQITMPEYEDTGRIVLAAP